MKQQETPLFTCQFEADKWNIKDWQYITRPDARQELTESWVQGDSYIENNNPIHTSMIYKNRQSRNIAVTTTLAFLDEMAPSMVIASEVAENQQGKMEYRKNFAIVVYNQGINVWRHCYKAKRSYWDKKAFWQFPLDKNEKYQLKVEIKQDAVDENLGGMLPNLIITVGNRTFGYIEKNLPDTFWLGLTGEEGINRFYDFRINKQA